MNQKEIKAGRNRKFTDIRRRAELKGMDFDLTREDVGELIFAPCSYCGAESSNKRKIGNYTIMHNGIDRIDSNKGYTKDNVTTCCSTCNYAKLELDTADFLAHVEKIYLHQNKTARKDGRG